MIRLLVCGDRNWTDRKKIEKAIRKALKAASGELVVISGGARGADTMAREVCEAQGIAFCEFPAHWEVYGRGAGPIRNAWMLKYGQPTLVNAFHSNIEQSKGTKDMVRRCRAAKVPVVVIQ